MEVFFLIKIMQLLCGYVAVTQQYFLNIFGGGKYWLAWACVYVYVLVYGVCVGVLLVYVLVLVLM